MSGFRGLCGGALRAGVSQAIGVGAGFQNIAGEGQPIYYCRAEAGIGEGLYPA
jgi:hypothetical protein